jgi:hypothetical protein
MMRCLAYLNDMVSIVVLDAIDYSTFELSYQSISLIFQDMLESLLYHLSSVSSIISDDSKKGTV